MYSIINFDFVVEEYTISYCKWYIPLFYISISNTISFGLVWLRRFTSIRPYAYTIRHRNAILFKVIIYKGELSTVITLYRTKMEIENLNSSNNRMRVFDRLIYKKFTWLTSTFHGYDRIVYRTSVRYHTTSFSWMDFSCLSNLSPGMMLTTISQATRSGSRLEPCLFSWLTIWGYMAYLGKSIYMPLSQDELNTCIIV